MTHNAFTTDQTDFQGFNDDGSITTATSIAAANTNWTQTVAENFRVRFVVAETGGDTGANNQNFQIQYNKGGAGWNDITASSQVARMANSINVVDGVSTTQRIGSGTFITPNNGYDEVTGVTDGVDIDFAGGDEVEVEYCIQLLAADLANDDTVQFRVVDDTGTALDAYSNTPTVTVTGIPAPTIEQKQFRIRYDDNGGGDDEGLNATWDVSHPALNTDASIQPDRRFRVRFVVDVDDTLTDGFELRYSLNSGAYTAVPTNDHHFGPGNSQTDLIAAVPSDQYADLATTTQVIGSGTYVASGAGGGCETGVSGEITFTANTEVEIEYCLVTHKLADNDGELKTNDTIDLRLYRDNGTAFDTYTQTPRLTIANRPGWIGGVSPEMGADNGPFVDGSSMYMMVERVDTASNNLPTIMISTDNGVSWSEATRTGAPTTTDTEGICCVYNANVITIFHRRGGSGPLVAHEFRTAGHASANTWGTVDSTVLTTGQLFGRSLSVESVGAGWRSATSDFLVVCHGLDTTSGDGTTWVTAGTLGSWDSPFEVDTSHGTDDLVGCQLVIGENSVGHVFYCNVTDGVLYHKTIAADATVTSSSLSPAQGTAGNTIASDMQSGVSDGSALTPPVYRQNGGTEEITIGWYNTSANLQVNALHDGTLQTVRTANDAAISDDEADHDGAYFAAIAVDPDNGDEYAFWLDNADHSKLMRADADSNSTYATPVTYQNSATLSGGDENRSGESSGGGFDVVWAKVITRSGAKVIAVFGSWNQGGVGTHYFETVLSVAAGGIVRPTLSTPRRHLLTR